MHKNCLTSFPLRTKITNKLRNCVTFFLSCILRVHPLVVKSENKAHTLICPLIQINPGRDVPPEYYLTNQTETDRQEMDRVVVGRGGSCELEYEVEAEGSLVRWEFVSTSYDVSYGLFYKEPSAAKKKPKHVPVVSESYAQAHLLYSILRKRIPHTNNLIDQ